MRPILHPLNPSVIAYSIKAAYFWIIIPQPWSVRNKLFSSERSFGSICRHCAMECDLFYWSFSRSIQDKLQRLWHFDPNKIKFGSSHHCYLLLPPGQIEVKRPPQSPRKGTCDRFRHQMSDSPGRYRWVLNELFRQSAWAGPEWHHLFFVTVIAKSGQRISHKPQAVQASMFTTSGYAPFMANTWVGQNSTQISQLLHHSRLIVMVGSFFSFSVMKPSLLFFQVPIMSFAPDHRLGIFQVNRCAIPNAAAMQILFYLIKLWILNLFAWLIDHAIKRMGFFKRFFCDLSGGFFYNTHRK